MDTILPKNQKDVHLDIKPYFIISSSAVKGIEHSLSISNSILMCIYIYIYTHILKTVCNKIVTMLGKVQERPIAYIYIYTNKHTHTKISREIVDLSIFVKDRRID